MNVSCGRCSTTYRVDPAKVPDTGIRARCTRCGEVITVPSASGGPAGADAASMGGIASNRDHAVQGGVDRAGVGPDPTVGGGDGRIPSGADTAGGMGVAGRGGEGDAMPRIPTGNSGAAPDTGVDRGPGGAALGATHDAPAGGTLARPVQPSVGRDPDAASEREPVVGVDARAPGSSAGNTGGSTAAPTPGTGTGNAPDQMSESGPAHGSPPSPSARAQQPAGPAESGGQSAAARRPAPVFGSNDPDAKARRLARALVSDIVVYHPDRRERSMAAGTLRDEFREEIQKSWEEYTGQVGDGVARGTPHFRDALNEILAGGKPVF